MSINLAISPDSFESTLSLPIDTQSSILTDIYQPNYNICIWKRTLRKEMTEQIHEMLQVRKPLALVKRVTPEGVGEYIKDQLDGYECAQALSEDIALIVDMFCCLFDVPEAGLRLTTLDKAMCPKFHVDKIPCRLVTTYIGSATQWLANDDISRNKLGATSVGMSAHFSGQHRHNLDIKQMQAGEVALLKGSGWQGNETRGLVHRSPGLDVNEKRLLLTLDML